MQQNLQLVLGTTNPAKQARLLRLAGDAPVSPLTPEALSVQLDVPEDGATHAENAVRKAVAWSRHTAGLALASDGGLLIPALGGAWDSLRTHRFAGRDATDAERVQRLLLLMEHLAGGLRRVRWTEAVALARNGTVLGVWAVQSGEGIVAEAPNASAQEPGFWFSSLWFLPSIGKWHAQATSEDLERAGDHWHRLGDIVTPALARVASALEMGKPV
jgi:XTP/dITP diphosphohydrolase